LLGGFIVQPPFKNGPIDTAADEASVVLRPYNALDFSTMTFENHILRTVCTVEIEDLDQQAVGYCEEVTSVGELNLFTGFDGQFFVLLYCRVEDVQKTNLVGKTDYNVKSTGMNGDTVWIFVEGLRYF